jgi:hypothetical protein
MRFHATLFSVYSGVPMIPIYTTKKIRNFLLDIQWTYENVLEKNSKDLPTFFDKTAWWNTFKQLTDPLIYLDAKKQLLQITANFKQQSLHETPTIRKFMDCSGKPEEFIDMTSTRILKDDIGVQRNMILDMGNLYPEKDNIEYISVPPNLQLINIEKSEEFVPENSSNICKDDVGVLVHDGCGNAHSEGRLCCSAIAWSPEEYENISSPPTLQVTSLVGTSSLSLSEQQQILYTKLQRLAQEYGKDDFRALDNKESQQIAVQMVSHYLTHSLDSSYNHGLMDKMFSMDYPFISEWTWVENDVSMKHKHISAKSSVSFSKTHSRFAEAKPPAELVVLGGRSPLCEGYMPSDQQSIESPLYPMRFNISYIDQNDRSGVHRSGWKFVYDHIQSFQDSSESAILLDLYVDRTFHWKRNIYRNIDVIPYTKPWIGFVHHTFNTDFSEYNNHNLLNTPEFLQSLPYCRGLIVLSKTLQQQFIEFLSQTKNLDIQPVPVYALRHPTDFDVSMFDHSMFLSNKDKKLLHIGGWMRNIFSFYQMDISSGFTEICTTPIKVEKKMDEIPKKKWCDCFSMFQRKPNKLPTDLVPEKTNHETLTNYQLRKVILKGKNMNNYFPHEEWKEQIYHSLIVPNHTPSISSESPISISEMYCSSNHKIHNNWIKHMMEYLHKISKDIEIMEYVDNHNYDQLLTKNIVFLNLVDGSAINTLLECLVRNTPIVVNRHPAVIEILGDKYPLFYDNVFMVGRMLQEPGIIYKTHVYMTQLDKSSFHMDFFLTQLNKIVTKTMKVT